MVNGRIRVYSETPLAYNTVFSYDIHFTKDERQCQLPGEQECGPYSSSIGLLKIGERS